MSQHLEWMRFEMNGAAALGYRRDILYCAPQLLQSSICGLFKGAAKAFWCLNLVGHDYHQSHSDTGNKKTRGWLQQRSFWYRSEKKHLLVSSCHRTALIKKKNDTLRLKCGYRRGCHMQWQFGSRGSYHEKDIVVHLTGEIYSPNRWCD